MGKIVFNSELRKDLDEFGAASFEFSILEKLDTAVVENSEQGLLALCLAWQEKLQPFDERGYNSKKAYQRDLGRLLNQQGRGRV
jgi:hypothetical protein